jgi:hypothetical protein
MSLKQALAANRWIPRLLAVVTVSALNFAWVVVAHEPRSVGLPPSLGLDGLGAWCVVMSVRTGLAQAGVRLAAEATESVELRTPRVPDAGPDQCPVCGGFGLDALAADDQFMERGPDRAKVVTYGPRRAHWDCAEVVPYKPVTAVELRAEAHRAEHVGQFHPDCFECLHSEEPWRQAAAREHAVSQAQARERARERRRQSDAAFAASVRPPATSEHSLDEMELRAAANAAWCEEQSARMVEETRRRWTS